MVTLCLEVHALPSSTRVVDEFGFGDLSEEAIVIYPVTLILNTGGRILCVCHHNVFVEGVGLILSIEAA